MTTNVRVTFGDVEFSGTDIREAIVTEEFNPLSITLPISTLNLLLYSEDADFSILNPAGDYEDLKYRAPLAVYASINGVEKFIGQYFLKSWENKSETLIRFQCMDSMGVLNSLTTYLGGIWLTPITMGELIDTILGEAGVSYDLDPNLTDVELTGWIPVCTYREALQQVLIAGGGYAICARQLGGIKIGTILALGVTTKGIITGVGRTGQSRNWKKRWRPSQWEGVVGTISIPRSEQGANTKPILRPLITGVDVEAHDITEGTGTRKLFDGELAIGVHDIIFSQPMHTLSVSGAIISASGANYAELTVASAGAVTLDGSVYDDTVTVFSHGTPPTPPQTENRLRLENGSLVNSANAATIAELVYNYYAGRYKQSAKLIKPLAKIGDPVLIETLYDREINGIVEKMVVNLAGGYLAQTDVIGSVEPL